MKKGLMLIVLVAGLCGITKAQAQDFVRDKH